jgi:hypothetical protein
MEVSALCSTCRSIHLQPLLFGPLAATQGQDIGALRKILAGGDCALCRFLAHTMLNFYGKAAMDAILDLSHEPIVTVYQGPLDVTFDMFSGSDKAIPCYVEIGLKEMLLGTSGLLTKNRNIGDDRMPQIISLRETSSTLTTQYGRLIDPRSIDWSMVKEWLALCLGKSHINTADDLSLDSQDRAGSLELRVIDVVQACVTRLRPNVPYVALSYVWGRYQRIQLRRDNLVLLSSPGYLNSAKGRPSRTILDAMHVVLVLGYRYLWVDALCIVQDDPAQVIQNVESMHLVYSGACLTLVAAAGEDADHGLTGTSADRPRAERQNCMQAWGLTMANRLDGTINISKWNSRGWTYQERVLSRRLLFFTASQLRYHCHQGCDFQEQFHVPPDGARFEYPDPSSMLDFEDQNLFDVYVTALKDYTKRSLSDPLDRLRAFDGIMKCLSTPLKGPFFFGLPSTLFDAALLWHPVGPCRRGPKEFPSWSWAGWTGAVRYSVEPMNDLINFCECIANQCSIRTSSQGVYLCHKIAPGVETSLPGRRLGNSWTRFFDDDSGEISYASSEPGCSGYRYPRLLSGLSQVEVQKLAEEDSPVLSVQGRTAQFWLTGRHSGFTSPTSTCYSGRHDQCNLAVLDDKGQAVGMVLVPSWLVFHLQNKTHNFLALSRSTLYRIDEDISWNPVTKSFRSWTHGEIDDMAQQEQKRYEEYRTEFTDWTMGEAASETPGPVISQPAPRAKSSSYFLSDAGDDLKANRGPFDSQYLSDDVPWPLFNVLLLSEPHDGIVERLGIGQIHVDAFGLGTKKVVLLG